MKRGFKLILFLGISLFILLGLITFLLPSRSHIMESITIRAPKGTVLNTLKDMESYPEWFPWTFNREDKMEYAGEDRFRFKGDQEGESGFYEITSVKGDSIIYYEMRLKGMPVYEGSYLLKERRGSVFLVWELTMKAGWKPWWRFYAAVMYKMVSPMLDKGLDRLKQVCEG